MIKRYVCHPDGDIFGGFTVRSERLLQRNELSVVSTHFFLLLLLIDLKSRGRRAATSPHCAKIKQKCLKFASCHLVHSSSSGAGL